MLHIRGVKDAHVALRVTCMQRHALLIEFVPRLRHFEPVMAEQVGPVEHGGLRLVAGNAIQPAGVMGRLPCRAVHLRAKLPLDVRP
ncbi:hypothetical protein DF196_08255 [Bifidobacterium callitrichidarum]|uniref:Uncharacterized protein n=1 Tax=Bifidobacterium callitrichidarum TaxID=2052941 RepID=A0A2U2N6G3_9BIFI|nr:hypothetical protein DF196_08255 [Bifidobacterium callitrichidarum]